MRLRIGFRELEVRCLIGILPHELSKPQEIFISVEVGLEDVDCEKLIVDYRDLAAVCEEVCLARHHPLLETLGKGILEALEARFPISSAKIRIDKPSALPKARATFIELQWGNHHEMDSSDRWSEEAGSRDLLSSGQTGA